MNTSIELATEHDTSLVVSVLLEAAEWLVATGRPMWQLSEITLAEIQPEVKSGHFFIARVDGETAGVVKFQLHDPVFWPDIPPESSAFIHRLAVRRKFAGSTVSRALIAFAASRATALKRQFLRLDCADRLSLRALYERVGFQFHSMFEAGPWRVARYELSLGANNTLNRTRGAGAPLAG